MMKLKLFPSCRQQPKTTSFRGATMSLKEEDIYKIINAVYFNPDDDSVETTEPWFTNSSESASTITELDDSSTEAQLEEIIRGAQQSTDQRLFCEPVGETSSILSDGYKDVPNFIPSNKNHFNEIVVTDFSKINRHVHSLTPNRRKRQGKRERISDYPAPPASLKESVTMAVDSEDPYDDFKRSMEEMMESMDGRGQNHDWEALEELLGWYLKANHKSNHGHIVGAFVELLVSFVAEDNEEIIQAKSTTSFSSAASSLCSSASSSA